MTADSIEELHFFALSIGLKKIWFQNSPDHKHYDLTPYRRNLALSKGVVQLSQREYVLKVKELRKTCY
jgi:hypothetical protein